MQSQFTPFAFPRFWSKVDRSGGPESCWPWIAARHRQGYGHFKLDGAITFAHRIAYLLVNGDIPAGLVVCHRCDNPACCNPAHLFTGTMADNCHDRDRKGRQVARAGQANGNARLTDEQAEEICERYRAPGQGSRYGNSRALAAEFGVNVSTITRIAHGRLRATTM